MHGSHAGKSSARLQLRETAVVQTYGPAESRAVHCASDCRVLSRSRRSTQYKRLGGQYAESWRGALLPRSSQFYLAGSCFCSQLGQVSKAFSLAALPLLYRVIYWASDVSAEREMGNLRLADLQRQHSLPSPAPPGGYGHLVNQLILFYDDKLNHWLKLFHIRPVLQACPNIQTLTLDPCGIYNYHKHCILEYLDSRLLSNVTTLQIYQPIKQLSSYDSAFMQLVIHLPKLRSLALQGELDEDGLARLSANLSMRQLGGSRGLVSLTFGPCSVIPHSFIMALPTTCPRLEDLHLLLSCTIVDYATEQRGDNVCSLATILSQLKHLKRLTLLCDPNTSFSLARTSSPSVSTRSMQLETDFWTFASGLREATICLDDVTDSLVHQPFLERLDVFLDAPERVPIENRAWQEQPERVTFTGITALAILRSVVIGLAATGFNLANADAIICWDVLARAERLAERTVLASGRQNALLSNSTALNSVHGVAETCHCTGVGRTGPALPSLPADVIQAICALSADAYTLGGIFNLAEIGTMTCWLPSLKSFPSLDRFWFRKRAIYSMMLVSDPSTFAFQSSLAQNRHQSSSIDFVCPSYTASLLL